MEFLPPRCGWPEFAAYGIAKDRQPGMLDAAHKEK